jgi:hypothetical protein
MSVIFLFLAYLLSESCFNISNPSFPSISFYENFSIYFSFSSNIFMISSTDFLGCWVVVSPISNDSDSRNTRKTKMKE